jgi:hypothetical protein
MKEKKMARRIFRMGLGAALVLFGLAVFGGCPQDTGTKENTEQVQVTNIPATIRGKNSYKIFVRVSTGQTAADGWVARGEAVIAGKNSVPMDLKDKNGNPWAEQGSFNLAVVISPQTVYSWEDIDVYGNPASFSSKIHPFSWGSGVHLNTVMPTQVKQLFNGEGIDDPGIICVEGSGIDFSNVK